MSHATREWRFELPVGILGTGALLPGRARTTAELATEIEVKKEPEVWERLTGIRSRHWVQPGERQSPYAAQAVAQALEAARLPASALKRLIMVHSSGGDLMFPATANHVAAALGLRGSCDAFDLNNACMGFLSGLDLAARSVATGLGPVAVVSAEICSRGVRTDRHRPYMVFGDAVAAAVVGPPRKGEGILATFLANDGTLPPDVYCEQPTLTGQREWVQFAKTSAEIAEIALGALERGVAGALARAEVALDDVDWVLPHQPNGAMLQALISRLGLREERLVRVVQETGSVASAAIPFSLDRLLRTRPVKPGHLVLMAGVGGGVSYGATLYRVGGA